MFSVCNEHLLKFTFALDDSLETVSTRAELSISEDASIISAIKRWFGFFTNFLNTINYAAEEEQFSSSCPSWETQHSNWWPYAD